MRTVDVLVLGAGAAGMMAAIEAGKRGRSVLVIDHARAPGEKIRISGGGRCNFTNVNATTATAKDRFLSANPKFALSALSRYTPERFVGLVRSYGIAFHEKTLGQLFCDGSSVQIVNLLMAEMNKAGAGIELGTTIEAVEKAEPGFHVRLSSGEVTTTSLIVATGGKSIPKMGATGFGYRLAEQFGLKVTQTRPALVPLTFEPRILERLAPLSGVSTDATATANRKTFREALLFTHRGLSGPAILQISSYWREGDAISIVLPSGVACATSPAPIVPAAPSRFSTTTCLPKLSVSFNAIWRATMSAAVPVENATTMRSGRSGNVCAHAAVATPMAAMPQQQRATAPLNRAGSSRRSRPCAARRVSPPLRALHRPSILRCPCAHSRAALPAAPHARRCR